MRMLIPLILIGVTFLIAFGIHPENTIKYFIFVKERIINRPGETLMCGGIILSIFIFWPWKDNK